MKLVRIILLFVLALGIFASLPTLMPVTAQEPIAPPLSALRLNLTQVEQSLDRGDIADAVRQLESGWKQQYEEYYQGQLTSQLLGADQIAYSLDRIAQLTGKKSALIYAVSTPEQLELILLSPQGQPQHRRIDATRDRLTATVQTFRRGVVNVRSQPSDYLPAAQQLYQWLIAPLQTELQAQKIDTLVFCLGTGLRSLPLAALHDGQQFLVEQYSLGIIPAFNLLDRQPSRLAGTEVLAMGASEFQQEAPLPAVPVELSAIHDIWQGEIWLNQAFTIENLRSRRSAYPFGIVHLATHAAFAPGSVNQSYIQFWHQQLQLDRLKNLSLRLPVVQLLVLSACRTALGDPNAELGFAGLAVQSGAKAALASLWSVSDAGTLVMMVDFYQRLQTAPIKTEALRQAQQAMLSGQLHLQSPSILLAIRTASEGAMSDGALSIDSSLPPELQPSASIDLSHPYYWAAFTMVGNPW